MGPRSEERGNSVPACATTRSSAGFNGAALRRTRKSAVNGAEDIDVYTLQWGRAPKNAEIGCGRTAAACAQPRFNGAALRRTRKCRRGFSRRAVLSSFNGAALRRTRKSLTRSNSARAGAVLQWGRAPKNAEIQTSIVARQCLARLQWGRAPKNAEIISPRSLARRSPRFNGAALRRTRKCLARCRGVPRHDGASMGPRSEERGNNLAMSRSNHFAWLQWGRAPKNAEIDGGVVTIPEAGRLQWGRAPKNAEIQHRG